MTTILAHDGDQIRKWRAQATIAGNTIKNKLHHPDKTELKVGFAFDDAVVTVTIPMAMVRESTAEQLGDDIYEMVLAKTQTSESKGRA